MAGMPERIGKGRILSRLDLRYAQVGKNAARLGRLKTLQAAGKKIADIGKTPDNSSTDDGGAGPVLSPSSGDHINFHWFGDTTAPHTPGDNPWWGNRDYAEKILRRGLEVALEEATAGPGPGKPIETLWICSGDRLTGPFEVYVVSSAQQVTFIIFSPNLPDSQYLDDLTVAAEQKIWVVKRIDETKPKDTLPDGPKTGDVDLDKNYGGGSFSIIKRHPRTR